VRSARGSLAGYAAAIGCGLAFFFALQHGIAYGRLVWLKATGSAAHCPWPAVLRVGDDALRFDTRQAEIAHELKRVGVDADLGLVQIHAPKRAFWLRQGQHDMKALDLLAYLLAESEVMARLNDHYVRPHDIVIDVGAHVGVFTAAALRHGAAKVLMVEPDPLNIECLRRNFASEIASGRVILVPEGAWSSEGTFKLYTGLTNSGMNTMVLPEQGAGYVDVRTRPIDAMVAEAGLLRVDFIKMDIEGAEREALRGAVRTLKQWKPRLMLDAYHRPDDPVVLPAVIRAGDPGYQFACVSCGFESGKDGEKIRPYLLTVW
jgi:FkbM family methyltransferase